MRVVFLCPPRLDEFQVRVLEPFFTIPEHVIAACVVDRRPRRSARERLIRNLKKGRGGYVAVMALRRWARDRTPAEETTSRFERRGVPIVEARKPYSEEVLAKIRDARPDVLALVGGFGIIGPKLLDLAPHGVLSYHHGDMRAYRGQPPGFWELYRGEREMGMTVQRLSRGLDEGAPVVERRIAIEYGEDETSLRRRLFEASHDMMFEAVGRLGDPAWRPERLPSYGRVYTLPNLRQWLALRVKIGGRRLRRGVGRAAW